MRANCESIQRTSHCIRFQVILREASFSQNHRYRLHQWNGLDLRIKNWWYFLQVPCLRRSSWRFSAWENGPLPCPFAFQRFLASDLRQDGELYLEAPQRAVFFSQRDLEFPKKIQDVYKFSLPRNHENCLGNLPRWKTLRFGPNRTNRRPFDGTLRHWTLQTMTKGPWQKRVRTALVGCLMTVFEGEGWNSECQLMQDISCYKLFLQRFPRRKS